MRKQLTVILLSALMLSGCASGRMGNPGAIVGGAAIGGSLGSSIGGLIGRISRLCHWKYCWHHCRCSDRECADCSETGPDRGICLRSGSQTGAVSL